MSGHLSFVVGDRVRVERDEERYPPRGSWHRYRGRVGTVGTVNRRDGEVGVALGAGGRFTWFAPWELVVVSRRSAAAHGRERA